MVGAEHILLESDERTVPTRETARRVHARVVLHGGFGRRSIELALIDYFYLSVRIARAQSIQSQYVLDLRFVDPEPRLARRFAWPWIAAGMVFLALAIAVLREVSESPAPWWRHEWLPATAALFVLAAGALAAAYRLTTETLALVSAHGRARLLAHVGSLGTFRALRGFLPRLVAHLRVACRARRRSRAQHLRDEMREHFRLRGAGALTEAEYESAKRRILATHVPAVAARAPNKKAREATPGPCRPMIRA
jgi:hypothetical protein